MRICLVNSFFPPWRGGAETYTYNLAKHLIKRNHDVEVFCAAPPRQPGRYTIENIRLNSLPVTAWLYGTPIAAKLPWKLLNVDADLIHAGFPGPYNAFSASLASCLKGTPSILTWHNDLPPVTATAKLLVGAHNWLALPPYIRTFKRIVATSRKYVESSRILRKYAEKVIVVPNGVDCQKFHPHLTPNPVRQRLGNAKIVLFVGALSKWHSYKGLDVLIKAFSLVSRLQKDTVLLVIGEGGLRPTYERLALELKLADKVIFEGDVSDQDLPSYYAASDLLILPSKDRSEGFGLTILEANACGKAAIGSDVGGIPEAIHDGFNGLLVPPNDPQALSAALRHLIEDDSLRVELGRNGRAFAEQHDWSRVAETMEQIYSEVMHQHEIP